jgi:hypothetical protein
VRNAFGGGGIRNAYKILVDKREKTIKGPTHRFEDNIKNDLRKKKGWSFGLNSSG